jgi:phospholipase C
MINLRRKTSQPNYLAMTSGEFHGLNGDQFLALPKNVSTIVDLLEAKDISWASYQENLPFDGFGEDSFTSHNYINSSLPDYTYYERKHNPLIIHNSVASIAERALRVRNFNDLAVDIQADTMPQWSFITPNMVNDAHNTDIDFTSKWLEYFLVPLLENPNFNSEETLVILTFDENEGALFPSIALGLISIEKSPCTWIQFW